mgnify:CR=1 FL=1
MEDAKLVLDGKEYNLPVIVGTENEKAIDIKKLRDISGYITLDSGLGNSGSCTSAITYLDGENGILRYRGIPIEQLAEKSTFVETSYLLINGNLPSEEQLSQFSAKLTQYSLIHEDMKSFFDSFPPTSHPMAILSSMVMCLSGYYPELLKPNPNSEEIDIMATELLSKVRTIAAYSYRKSVGLPFVYPKRHYPYVKNFLHMMFSNPLDDVQVDDEAVRALNVIFILHADHEQNCSTSTVRLVGSSQANLFASVSAGICALWGPLHGGANQSVIEMLEEILKDGLKPKSVIHRAKDKNNPFRLYGFGHRVYKNYDPRATIIKKNCDIILNKFGIDDPLLDIAKELEELALHDDYFIERKLYPNVDFYSGIILRALGIPTNMFTVIFAIGRLPGWIAHWKEMKEASDFKIWRPRQIYVGNTETDYIPKNRR